MSTITLKWLALGDVTLAPGVSYVGRKGPGALALEFALDDFDDERDLRDEVQEVICSELKPVELPK